MDIAGREPQEDSQGQTKVQTAGRVFVHLRDARWSLVAALEALPLIDRFDCLLEINLRDHGVRRRLVEEERLWLGSG